MDRVHLDCTVLAAMLFAVFGSMHLIHWGVEFVMLALRNLRAHHNRFFRIGT
jgi:hypothetical protein